MQREHILPSEKAFAYQMKLEAMKRKAGRPSKEMRRNLRLILIKVVQMLNLVSKSVKAKTKYGDTYA